MSDIGSWLLIAARDVDDYAYILEHSGAARRQLGERLREAAQEIARLTERCDAYLGQVKAGDEQILALRSRAKEMQREKAELRQRCDAYREALADVMWPELADWARNSGMPALAETFLKLASLSSPKKAASDLRSSQLSASTLPVGPGNSEAGAALAPDKTT